MRRALYEAPENVATLIRVITARLFNLVSDHTFPTPPTASTVTSFASSFIKNSTGNQDRNPTKEVLNCLRILQRVLPVVFETESDASRVEMDIFWRREVIEEESVVVEETSKPQFVIEDDDDDGEEQEPSSPPPAGPSQSHTPGSKAQKTLPSIADRLFSCLIDLLFCCGFTLPTKIQVDHYKINYTIWYVYFAIAFMAAYSYDCLTIRGFQGERCRLYRGPRLKSSHRKQQDRSAAHSASPILETDLRASLSSVHISLAIHLTLCATYSSA